MKKKIITIVLSSITAILMSFCVLAGCDGGKNKVKDEDLGAPDAEYVIQYVDDSGPHQITVKGGMPYSLDTLPTRNGYVFTGLFDAERGGTQYVSASGASLSPFTDRKNMVLFPQFKAKEYTFILNYGVDLFGEEIVATGERQVTVAYNQSLPELPKEIEAEHAKFSGWYTEPDCGGVRVADRAGIIPKVSVVNDSNFDLSDDYVNLYAGLEPEKYTVTCYFGDDEPETVRVPWGTPASQIVTERRENGNAVLSWSTKSGDPETIFTGKITGEKILHALEYAPILEFDTNGGNKVKPVIQRAGTVLSLPVPTKKSYKFSHWENESGSKFGATNMPSKSAKLKAVWNAMIVFDENGGSEVDDISVSAGNIVKLPTTEKNGYIFAGWYKADRTQYTSAYMPSGSITLKAGWYQTKSRQKTFISGESYSSVIPKKTPALQSNYLIDFTEECSEVNWSKTLSVTIEFHADIQHYRYGSKAPALYATKEHFYFYSEPQVNDAYLLDHIIVDHGKGSVNESLVTCTFKTTLPVKNGKIYTALAADKDATADYGYAYTGWRMKNYYCTINYPDTSTLYL